MGKPIAMASEPSEAFLVSFAVINHSAVMAAPMIGYRAMTEPPAVATPLPPLKPRVMGNT